MCVCARKRANPGITDVVVRPWSISRQRLIRWLCRATAKALVTSELQLGGRKHPLSHPISYHDSHMIAPSPSFAPPDSRGCRAVGIESLVQTVREDKKAFAFFLRTPKSTLSCHVPRLPPRLNCAAIVPSIWNAQWIGNATQTTWKDIIWRR